MKPLIIIPAYNEQESLPRVVDALLRDYPQYDCVVVNDGSRDNTARICRERGCPLLDLPVNLGLAGAVQTGLKYAYAHGYTRALQLDADGQHRTEYIAPLLAAMDKTGADIVVGSRFLTVKKPKTLRMVGSYLISWAMRLTTGVKICDPTSGMRLYGPRMISEFATDANYTPEPDTISYLLKNGARVTEVQVKMDERIAGQTYLNFSRSAAYMIRMGMSILIIQWFRKRGAREEKI
ncbi:MAG: glycosyltransferase family 2 protein [Ruthenibacterium sp.]